MATTPSKAKTQVIVPPKKIVAGLSTGTQGSGLGPGIFLLDKSTSYTLTDLGSQLRQASDDKQRVRILARVAPDASSAVSSLVRAAKTKLTLTAYDPLKQVSPEGQQILTVALSKLFDTVDYTEGFNGRQSLQGVLETLLREVPLTGATSAELVLDKAALPSYVAPVSPYSLKWAASKTTQISAPTSPLAYKPIPYQIVLGAYVYLDVPNFFYASMDQDPTTPYSASMLEPSVMPSILYEDVIRDIHRVVRQTGHSKLYVKILFEKMKEAMPADVRSSNDQAVWEKWFEDQRTQIDTVIANLTPEQGLTLYDTAEAGYIDSKIAQGADYGPLLETLDSRMASSLKTPAAVLSKRMGSGSQNVASTEALLYLLTAEAIQAPVSTVLSRLFTLAVRLTGFEGSVEATFAKPSLRPDVELEAFRSMHQTNVLNLLSLGFITDEEAATLLGTGPLAPGHAPLSGTGFMQAAKAADPSALADPTSNADPAKRAVTGNMPTDTPNRAAKPSKKT
jgi:hypothetical protein